jgi:photosystem II stability/assembly factor-like uncharacterized protein
VLRSVAVVCGALIAGGVASVTADAASLGDLLSGHFVAVPAAMLPSGTTYDDATCPSDDRCFAVGSDGAGGVITTTDNAGRTWTTAPLPSTSGLNGYSISCPSASVCYVGGTDLRGDTTLLSTHDAGARWTAGAVPSGQIVTSIGCGAVNVCITVGSDIPSRTASSVLTTDNGGASWTERSAPPNGLVTVRCLDERHCWAAGPGAWFTADLGQTWRDISPPAGPPDQTSFIGSVYYSQMVDIEFQSAEDGWEVGGDQCGGAGVTYCAGVAMHTSDGGSSWSVSAASQRYPFGWQIACQGATCLLDGQGFAFSVIATTTDNGATFTEMQQVPTGINALACTPSHELCIAAGGKNNIPALLTLGHVGPVPSPSKPSILSTVGGSLTSPGTLLAAPLTALVNALITVGLIVLITFPSQLFNRTYEENHERIRGWWERRFAWTARVRQSGQQLTTSARGALSFAVVLLVGGVLAAMLDPAFGPNVRSLALFVGAVLAIVAGVAVSALGAGAYRRSRHRVGHWRLRALPSALLVAVVCVLISRITQFQPGYLYGLIGGVAFTGHLNSREEGHEVAIASVGTLIVSIAAWLVWVPVSSAAAADPGSFGLALLENFLAALFLSGMVGLVIGLVPLRFLPGERVARWHRGVWAILFGVACLAVVEVMVRPQSAAARHAEPFWTTIGLFVAFGLASVAFWGYFKVQRRPGTRGTARQTRQADWPSAQKRSSSTLGANGDHHDGGSIDDGI